MSQAFFMLNNLLKIGLGLLVLGCLFVWRYDWFLANKISPKLTSDLLGKQFRVCEFPDWRYEYRNYIVCADSLRLLVRTDNFNDFNYGDLISVSGKLSSPEMVSYARYLSQFGIQQLVEFPDLVLIREAEADDWQSILWRLKRRTLELLFQRYHEPYGSLAAGLLLGYRGSFSPDLNAVFQRLGLTHILAVSGANIALLIYVFDLFGFFISRFWRLWLTLFVLLVFCLLVGGAAVVRATLMGVVFLVARNFGFDYANLKILFWVFVLMVMFNPLMPFVDIGFWLSFVATAGIIILVPIAKKFKLPEYVAVLLAAQIATAPLVMIFFANNFVLAFLANLLLGWLIPFLTVGVIVSLFVPYFDLVVMLVMQLFFFLVEAANSI
ncbi:ComEC/Rec2 family competence protein [Candidatus Gracilibacteria bacterium]|nr:ComEC/Rec2 family competence protein [Candidatus Gracilibacteria bacterium]